MGIQPPRDIIHSKLAGVTMGDKSANGTPLRQLYIEKLEAKNILGLRLVREPDNAYDSDAIAVHADYGSGDIQLGYIQNKNRICLSCSKEYPKVAPNVEMCPCGGMLARKGLASTLSAWIDEGVSYRARVEQYTGGVDGKNRGVNIVLERIK